MHTTDNDLPLDDTRREFLEHCRTMLAGLAIVGIGGPMLQGCDMERVLNPVVEGSTLVIDVAALDTDGKFLVTGSPDSTAILVVRRAAGSFVALSMICTHQACQVAEPVQQVMTCPCHLSKFNLDGSVLQGPATLPLRQYVAALNPDGKLVVTL